MCVDFTTNKQQLVARRAFLDSMEEEEEVLSSRIPDLVFRYKCCASEKKLIGGPP